MTTKSTVKTVEAKDLSLSQARTLHRMWTGTLYKLRADGKVGGEVRGHWTLPLASAPSIPALYRLGLVEFLCGVPSEKDKFAIVNMTSLGFSIAKEFDKAVRGVS